MLKAKTALNIMPFKSLEMPLNTGWLFTDFYRRFVMALQTVCKTITKRL